MEHDNLNNRKSLEGEESREDQYIVHFQIKLAEEGAVTEELLDSLKAQPRHTLIALRDIMVDLRSKATDPLKEEDYVNIIAIVDHALSSPNS